MFSDGLLEIAGATRFIPATCARTCQRVQDRRDEKTIKPGEKNQAGFHSDSRKMEARLARRNHS